jgi:two-component system alkaline phosphatase synthesis response regulator PhoP
VTVWGVGLSIVGIIAGVLVTISTVRRETKAAQLKSDFVANVTHELKTPLTSIRMFLDTLLLGRVTDEAEARECLQVMARESERLTRLIEQLLVFSRIESRRWRLRLNFEHPRTMVDDALKVLADQLGVASKEALGIEVVAVQELTLVAADRFAMVEAILNILHNAWKYSPASRAAIRVVLASRRRHIEIAVEDNGIGVPRGDRRRIFVKFERGSNAEEARIQGSGVGLSLALSILEAHRRDDHLHAARAHRLALLALDSQVGRAELSSPLFSARLRGGLEVGDDPGHRGRPGDLAGSPEEPEVRGLRRHHGHPRRAGAGAGDRQEARPHHPRRHAPDPLGFEICKTLKRNEVDIPIIILSAKDQEIDKIMGLDLGADDYITKPFSIREVVARINAVLRRKKRYEKDLETFDFGAVHIDFGARTVACQGKLLELSPREFDLLGYFVRHPNEVIDRRQILNKVWGFDYYGTARTIDNFVTKLRQKLEPDPENPVHFQTARGIGYKFVP